MRLGFNEQTNGDSYRKENYATERKAQLANMGASRVSTHFGEILQGQFVFNNKVRRALVTLPCPVFYSSARFDARLGEALTVEPKKCRKALNAASLTLEQISRTDWGGRLWLESNIPESIGGGSSTGDVVATIRAVANAFNLIIQDTDIARLAVAAETASDSTMIESGHAVLFAQREGMLLETFGPLPRLQAVGTTDGEKVDTLSYPPAAYNEKEIDGFMALLEMLRRAVKTNDTKGVAEVATQSAIINQKFLPKPNFEKLLNLADVVGALGISVSHSGSAVSFLFDATNHETADRAADLIDRLSCMGKTKTLRFQPVFPTRTIYSERINHVTPK